MSTWWCFLTAFSVGFWNKINLFQVKPFQKFSLMKTLTKTNFIWFFFKNLGKRYPTHIIWQAILYVQVCAWKLLNAVTRVVCYQHISFETYSICIRGLFMFTFTEMQTMWNVSGSKKRYVNSHWKRVSVYMTDWRIKCFYHSFMFCCCIVFEKIFLCDLVFPKVFYNKCHQKVGVILWWVFGQCLDN